TTIFLPNLSSCIRIHRAGYGTAKGMCRMYRNNVGKKMKAMRLKPAADCREEIAFRLRVIEENKMLNAILGVNPDAQAQAEFCHQASSRGIAFGPLHGVPLIIKDNIACADLPITLGCRALASLRATSDSLVVQRLRAAGAIILARAN